jgi:hypothetical protein
MSRLGSPAASTTADVEATFRALVGAGALEEGHRRVFSELWPANAAVIDEAGPERASTASASRAMRSV